jgi:hypothetical protein
MVIHEGFLAPGAGAETGFASLAGYEQTRRRLTSCGDEILREHVLSPEDMKAIDDRYIETIERRARGIAAAHPCAAWLLRKPRRGASRRSASRSGPTAGTRPAEGRHEVVARTTSGRRRGAPD